MKTEDSDTTSSIVEFADKLRTDAVSVATPTPSTGEQLQEVVIADEIRQLRRAAKAFNFALDPGFVDAGLRAVTGEFERLKAFASKHSFHRPRRSRQVRGKRARNYVRALARNEAGSPRNEATERIKNEGKATGSVEARRRQNALQAEAARKRARES